MADMPTAFWGGWIAVITIVSLLGLGWLVFSIYFSSNGEDESESPVWDETLSEGNRPAPMWWFWLILVSMIASVAYLMLYPGLGNFDGMLQWSQGGRLADSMRVYRDQFADDRFTVTRSSIAQLHDNERAMDTARRIYSQNCSACHGPDGKGQASAFPDLTDRDWQWGASPAQIEQSIRNGRQAAMVGWQAALGSNGVDEVTDYVMSLSDGLPHAKDDPGNELYSRYCIACHGPTGAGNPVLGAPDLSDDIWLYGGTTADVRESISAGRNGQMPAFDARLDDVQIKLLLAWLTRPGAE